MPFYVDLIYKNEIQSTRTDLGIQSTWAEQTHEEWKVAEISGLLASEVHLGFGAFGFGRGKSAQCDLV